MPNRYLKESIRTSQSLNQLTAEEERLFYHLIVCCDDFGRMEANPKVIRANCFPLKIDELKDTEIINWLCDLSREVITLYSAGGKLYLEMRTFQKHNQVRAKRSKYPGPKDAGSVLFPSSVSKCKQMLADVSKCKQMLLEPINHVNHAPVIVPVIVNDIVPVIDIVPKETETPPCVPPSDSSESATPARLPSRNPYIAEMQAHLGYPGKTQIDPIPNPGKEAAMIKKMLSRGFVWSLVFSTWAEKVDARREFVSMTWVNEDIGKNNGGGNGANRPDNDPYSTEAIRASVGRPLH